MDGIRLHINLANEEITKAEVAKAKAERDSKKLATSLESNTASLEEISEDLETLESSLEEVNQYVQKLQSTVRDAQAAEENQKDALETLKTQLDEKTDEIQAFRKKEARFQPAPRPHHTHHLFFFFHLRWSFSRLSRTARRSWPTTTSISDIGKRSMTS